MRCHQGHDPELLSIRMRLVQEKSEVAALERQLLARRGLATVTRPTHALFPEEAALRANKAQLQEELQCENMQHEKLKRHLQMHTQAQESIKADVAVMLSELQAANLEKSAASRSIDGLRTELVEAQLSRHGLEQQLLSANAATDKLLTQQCGLEDLAATEWASARHLQQQLEEKGWGLALLRSTARSHVEDLRGSVNSLDEQVTTTSHDVPMTRHIDSYHNSQGESQGTMDSGSQQRRGYSKSSRRGASRLS